MQIKHFFLLILLSITAVFTGCNNETNENVEFVEPVNADSTILAFNNTLFEDTTFGFEKNAGAPSLWQSFETFFKSCVKSSNFPGSSLFGKYKLIYLGPYNPRYLGTIYSSDKVVPKTELTKWVSPEQLNMFTVKGIDVPSCDITQMRNKFLELTLANVPFTNSDSTLKIAWQNQDTIINSVGKWTVDGMNTEEFLKFLNESSDNADLKWYKNILVDKKNIVTFQIVKVSGFSADIVSKKNLTLQAEANISLIKTKTGTGADSTLFAFKYRTLNNKTVHVESSGEFYVFGLAMKGKKM